MQFKYLMPTEVFFGRGCIRHNSSEFSAFGKKALIVTGGSSARLSGALSDICEVLEGQGIEYFIFDKIENNPSLKTVKAGGDEAKRIEADFIVGIGGGSPLDAAKAVAVLAANDMDPMELFTNEFKNKPLPIIAVPTTAGTGSEVTPYSILTRDDLNTKRSFGNIDTFPKKAFLDAAYTESMPYTVTANTAVDAFTHCLEGYLGRKSTPVSDALACEGIAIFGKCLESLVQREINSNVRDSFLYMSMLGGIVISQTGTTVLHGMGYNLTYFKDVPHGKANGLLMAPYLTFNYPNAREKIDNVLKLLGVKDIDEFGEKIFAILGGGPALTDEEIDRYAAITMTQKSTASNIRPVESSDIKMMMRNMRL